MSKQQLTLVANPSGVSRRYAVYHKADCVARLHFEYEGDHIVCSVWQPGGGSQVVAKTSDLARISGEVTPILESIDVLQPEAQIHRVAVRVVVPGSYFLQHRWVDDEFVAQLVAVKDRAPMYVETALDEVRQLQKHYSGLPFVAVSDSAFHVTKPDYAWNYGISLEDADRLDIKRFGYHGLSAASVVDLLKHHDKLPPKVVVCHLGDGSSMTAIYKGRSIDTTMGYSPLDGVIMATRSGGIDPMAIHALRVTLGLDSNQVERYLTTQSGLVGLGGSSSVLELLQRETAGDHRAELALNTYVLSLQKAIGQMAAAMDGVDVLVFTGVVGERSAAIRERVLSKLSYLDFTVDKKENDKCFEPDELRVISRLARSKPVFVAPTDEEGQILEAASAVE